MNKKKSVIGLLLVAVISIAVMYMIDSIKNIEYLQKSAIKIVMFLILPTIYTLYDTNIKLKDNFKIKSIKSLTYSIALAIGVYLGILIVYFVLKDYIDLSNIMENLKNNANVDKNNYIYIALYISFINSLLEEFFFRGFIFLNLKKISERRVAYIASASMFSVYHLAFMGTWFNPLIFIIAMAGLFVGALIFNYLNEKSGNIYNSWIVHMMANLSINTVGLIMYGFI